MAKAKSAKDVVMRRFPRAQAIEIVDNPSGRQRGLRGVHKAKSLQAMQARLKDSFSAVDDAPVKVGGRKLKKLPKGPSGTVLVAPKNSDASGRRPRNKAMIVSGGKVIAVQG